VLLGSVGVGDDRADPVGERPVACEGDRPPDQRDHNDACGDQRVAIKRRGLSWLDEPESG
jgi:hypothetical protein